MKLIGKYKNGNYMVYLGEDGTKVRQTREDRFIPEFAENIDLKICNRCNMGCPMCHEGSTKDGNLGDIMNARFIDTLKPYQELAIGGGNVLEHPDLVPFLQKLKKKHVVANITLHQHHFESNQELIRRLANEGLVHGIGISLAFDDPDEEFIELVKSYPNAVIHVINGIVSDRQMIKLRGHGLKILILGYKELRRGKEYNEENSQLINERKEWLYYNIAGFVSDFDVVSFDNLAIEQLGVRRLLSEEEWKTFYMGDDSEFTYYIDAVERKFAKSSTAPLGERYCLLDDVVDMFNVIRRK